MLPGSSNILTIRDSVVFAKQPAAVVAKEETSTSSWFPYLATFLTFAIMAGLVALLIHNVEGDIMAMTNASPDSWDMPTMMDFRGLKSLDLIRGIPLLEWSDVVALFGQEAVEEGVTPSPTFPLLHGGYKGVYCGFLF